MSYEWLGLQIGDKVQIEQHQKISTMKHWLVKGYADPEREAVAKPLREERAAPILAEKAATKAAKKARRAARVAEREKPHWVKTQEMNAKDQARRAAKAQTMTIPGGAGGSAPEAVSAAA